MKRTALSFRLLPGLSRPLTAKMRRDSVNRAILGGADEILVSWLDELIAGLKAGPAKEMYWKVNLAQPRLRPLACLLTHSRCATDAFRWLFEHCMC